MDIDTVRTLLDQLPTRSDYEFRNFELESQGAWHRQLRYVLAQKEQLTDRQSEIDALIGLANYELNHVSDPMERMLREKIAAAHISQMKRELADIRLRLTQIDTWLDAQTPAEYAAVTKNFEKDEKSHWSEQLGKQLGIELLSTHQASKESMTQVSLLPLSEYKQAVIISNQFASFLKNTAERAENSVAPNVPPEVPGTTSVVTPQQ